MKKSLLLLLALTLFFCNRQTDFEKKLIRSKWGFYPNKIRGRNVVSKTYLQFNPDGTAKNLDIDSDEESFYFYEGKKPDDTWKYFPEEKKLLVFGNEFKLLSVEGDTIRLFQKDRYEVMLYNIDSTYDSLQKQSHQD